MGTHNMAKKKTGQTTQQQQPARQAHEMHSPSRDAPSIAQQPSPSPSSSSRPTPSYATHRDILVPQHTHHTRQQHGQAPGNAYAYEDTEIYKVPRLFSDPIGYVKALWMLYESTFALSMLETWETLLLHTILITILYFIYWATRAYLPDHVRFLATRAKYYWLGEEATMM